MYLHSILSRPAIINKDVNSRSAKVRSTFKWLCESVWEKRGMQLTMTLRVYRAVIQSSLLYACETWTVYKHHAKNLTAYTWTASENCWSSPSMTKTLTLYWGPLYSWLAKHSCSVQRAHVRRAGHLIATLKSGWFWHLTDWAPCPFEQNKIAEAHRKPEVHKSKVIS